MTGSATIKRSIAHDVAINVTGAELAELFWDLDSDQQTNFFNRLGEIKELTLQLAYIAKSEMLTTRGRHAMITLAEFAQP